MKNLVACATNTHKSTINQDYCLTVRHASLGFNGVILADGIGSHFKSELASKFCCTRLKEILENLVSFNQLDLETHFRDVQLGLIEFAKTSEEIDFETIDKNQSLGTTLICLLDCGQYYQIAYAGNGSVWHIDGRFNKFGKNFYLPWNAINLLNPHCIEQDGKPALFRYLSISDTPFCPTVLKLFKNRFSPGEILIATTDGVYSNDAVPIGKDLNETLWIKGEESLPILFRQLSNFLSKNPIEALDEDLTFTLSLFLDELKDKSIMHDDTTIGAVISELAIEFHQIEFEKKSKLLKKGEEDSN